MTITTWADAAGLWRGAGPIQAALKACRRHIATAAAFSLALNVLHLAAPLYMMQIYDRVISSGSFATLAMLTIAVLAAFFALAGLDKARAQVLAAAGIRLDRLLSGRVFSATMRQAAASRESQRHALRDLDACRQFICGHGMTALFDLPWLPLYVAIGCVLHWSIGLFILFCAVMLVGVAVLSDMRLSSPAKEAHARSSRMLARAEVALRNAHSVRAMAMMPGLLRWNGLMNARQAFAHLRSLLGAGRLGDVGSVALSRTPASMQLVAEELSLKVPQRTQPILDNISFAIEAGTCVGLIGPSGAGKSFLARILVGANAPTAGSISLGSRDIGLWLDQGTASPAASSPSLIRIPPHSRARHRKTSSTARRGTAPPSAQGEVGRAGDWSLGRSGALRQKRRRLLTETRRKQNRQSYQRLRMALFGLL